MTDKEKLDKIKQLVEIGLGYNVDYIYVLEDIDTILNGKDIKINIENYLD
jgi:hypothetical protein